ncbi:MAG: FecR domain-containing protein, partial [Spirochaetales bacterium]
MKRVEPFLLVFLLILIPVVAIAQSGPGIGRVEFVDGDVRINGELATFGHEVGLGDWVETGPNSTIEIVFDRGNIFELGPNTVAKLDLGEARQQVDLKFGTLSAVFERVRTLSGRGTFDVRTSTAVAGVRGTTFFLRVIDGETTYVCTCNGSLELMPGNGNPFVETAAE